MRLRDRPGLTLIEMLVVLAVLAVLASIMLPMQHKATSQAHDAVARANVRTVLMVEMAWLQQHHAFTADRNQLLAFEPELPLHDSANAASGVYITVGQSRENPSVCLFAETAGDQWYAIYQSEAAAAPTELSSPGDCTRKMLDDQLAGPRQGNDPREQGKAAPGDTLGAAGLTNPKANWQGTGK